MAQTFPSTAGCKTNGCTESVTRCVRTDPRFCATCRRLWGENKRRRLPKIASDDPLIRVGTQPGDRLAQRLEDGFKLITPEGADDEADKERA